MITKTLYCCLVFLSVSTLLAYSAITGCGVADNREEIMQEIFTEEELFLTQEWDKTFAKSENVNHRKVTFHNHFGITLAADLYVPRSSQFVDSSRHLPAVAVCGPFGAVKEQVSGHYAQILAERGFVTLAFDPSYTGESGGKPRHVASPDINTEDFSAAVDYLATNDLVDSERIGILGICGWGGFALNVASLDTRIKATVTSTMYDMSRVTANGYFDAADTEEARYKARKAVSELRTAEYHCGIYKRTPANLDTVPDDAPFFVKDYHNYYKTELGYHPRSLGSTDGWNTTGKTSFLNTPMLRYADEIRSAVMLIHGEKAHSRYFSEDAYKLLKGDNKRLVIVPGAVHTDLYYKTDVIPFDTIVAFYEEFLR